MRLLWMLMLSAAAWGADLRLTVVGLGGEADYDTRFTMLGQEAQKRMGGELLSGAAATKARVEAALKKMAAEAKSDDTLVVVLIGHGTFDGQMYKFNVPGPDISAEDLRGWLDAIAAKQVVVLATSCSGGALDALKRDGRVVITATKSGTEKNAVVFGRYFVDGLRDAEADTDKNEIITAAEVYLYAKQKTTTFYETQKRIATEHAVLDDGGLSTRAAVVRFGAAQRAMADPAKKALLAKKEEYEAGIDKLKLAKAAMPVEEYKKQLRELLLGLARVQEELDK